MPKMVSEAAFSRTDPSAAARCCLRSRNSTRPRSLPVASWAARLVILRISRCTANLMTTASSTTKKIRTASCAGPARKTFVSAAAWLLCVMSQTTRQAIPGPVPQAPSSGLRAGLLAAAARTSTSASVLTAGVLSMIVARGAPR
ncbi:MAG: hypothetical protein ABSB01_05875 [Streptosporangiaceae bacterium]